MQLIPDFDLTHHNTLGLASRACHAAFAASLAEVEEVTRFATAQGLPLHVIGGGSNLVLRDRIDGVVAIMAMKGRTVTKRRDGAILVTAQAGEDWPAFVEWTVEQGFGGLENLAGIPGTVGAAPVQNIGAYGLELKDRFVSLTAYDAVEGRILSFDREDCRFTYRQSVFKGTKRYIILDVTLALPQPWRPVLGYKGLDDLPGDVGPGAIMERVLKLRREKLPDWRLLGNAGSFFHNPVVPAEVAEAIAGAPRYRQPDGTSKLSAAWLIEDCGLKGAREGQAGIHDGHALVVVNHGGATFDEVSRLSSRVKASVRDRFRIELVQEPVTV